MYGFKQTGRSTNMKLSNQEPQPSHRGKMIEIKGTNEKKNDRCKSGDIHAFFSFREEGSSPANKIAHLLYLWSHHEMFKKLNCQKSSEIK